MEAQYDDYEMVHVTREFCLIDAESYQRRYSRNDARPLPRGYYMVTWPALESSKRCNEHAVFHGPCTTPSEALALETSRPRTPPSHDLDQSKYG